jgi:phosphate transport system ATP-binding protein
VVEASVIDIVGLNVKVGGHPVLTDVSFNVGRGEIFAIIGPARSGKTTLLRVLNRTTDFLNGAVVEGTVRVLDEDILATKDVYSLRRRVGMVAPLPVGLPMSIYDNVAFAPRMNGERNRGVLDGIVERCLRRAALFEEVENRLEDLGTALSGGQQQRLAIARALSHSPEILCLDEFSIAIDPVTTMRIEEALIELRQEMAIVLATNLTQQARRLAGRTMFLLNGEAVETGPTAEVFSDSPRDPRTHAYVRGVFG